MERLQDFAARKQVRCLQRWRKVLQFNTVPDATQYQDAATLLLATTALFTQFEAYENVPKVRRGAGRGPM